MVTAWERHMLHFATHVTARVVCPFHEAFLARHHTTCHIVVHLTLHYYNYILPMVLTPSSLPNSPKKTRPSPTKNAQPPKGAKTPARLSSSSSSKTKTSVPPRQKNSAIAKQSSSKPSSKPAPKPQVSADSSSTQTGKAASDRAEQAKRVRGELHEHQRVRSYALLDAARKQAKEE